MKWTSFLGDTHALSRSASREEKVGAVLDVLTTDHLDHDGGYPYDYRHLGKYVVIADLDAAKEGQATQLVVFTVSALARWYDRALDHMDRYDETDFACAVHETRRAGDER